ncbi:unnamed protein product [Lathyrus sativus]|nr:unnamed protein product [Lathyrus sativus]
MAIYMEDLLLDSSFYANGATHKPIISEFRLVIPNDLGKQTCDSNDCGVWVIKWMEHIREDVDKIDVDDGTRLRIALDLTMNSYNKLNDLILERAWEKINKSNNA